MLQFILFDTLKSSLTLCKSIRKRVKKKNQWLWVFVCVNVDVYISWPVESSWPFFFFLVFPHTTYLCVHNTMTNTRRLIHAHIWVHYILTLSDFRETHGSRSRGNLGGHWRGVWNSRGQEQTPTETVNTASSWGKSGFRENVQWRRGVGWIPGHSVESPIGPSTLAYRHMYTNTHTHTHTDIYIYIIYTNIYHM